MKTLKVMCPQISERKHSVLVTDVKSTPCNGSVQLHGRYEHKFVPNEVGIIELFSGTHVWFWRRNEETGFETPYYWPVDRFTRFFEVGI